MMDCSPLIQIQLVCYRRLDGQLGVVGNRPRQGMVGKPLGFDNFMAQLQMAQIQLTHVSNTHVGGCGIVVDRDDWAKYGR